MKAFISYSHIDERYVQKLHVHLAQMKRDGLIDAWYDREISAGGNIDKEVSENLKDSDIFIAVVSPDFLASKYCYEKEMERAIKRHNEEDIILIPMIVEPSDWLNSPLKTFRATPRDGKPISEWSNPNTAYLDVVTDLRNITSAAPKPDSLPDVKIPDPAKKAPSFRVKKDFDKIDKIQFKKEAFQEISEKLKMWCAEANSVDGIKALFEKIDDSRFIVTLVNKNKSNSTVERTVYLREDRYSFGDINILDERSMESTASNGGYIIEADDYYLFLKRNYFTSNNETDKMNPTDAANDIWNNMMKSVGIEYAS